MGDDAFGGANVDTEITLEAVSKKGTTAKERGPAKNPKEKETPSPPKKQENTGSKRGRYLGEATAG